MGIAESKSTQNLISVQKKSENKMAAKTFFLVGAVVLLILQVSTVRAEDEEVDVFERASGAYAFNTNKVYIRLRDVCGKVQGRKRELKDLVERGAIATSSNTNRITITGIREACRCLGYRT